MSNTSSSWQRFCDINKGHWGDMIEGRASVLINVSGMPQVTVISGIAGRLFNELKYVRPVVLLSSTTKKHEVVKAVFNSFGITRFLRFSRNPWTRPLSLFKAYIGRRKAMKMINSEGFEFFIRNYEVDGIVLGDLIYDSFVRYGCTYFAPEKDKRKLEQVLLKALWLFYSCRDILHKESVKYVIISEVVYAISEGLLLRIAAHMHIKVMYVDQLFAKIYVNNDCTEAFSDRFLVSPQLLEQARKVEGRNEIVDDYLAKRFSGDMDHFDVINAYRGKRNWSRKELAEYFCMDEGRMRNKNVFIMPHCFSDANHKTRYMLFRDCYQSFLETLQIIQNVGDVNWFVKPHPSAKVYGEEGQVEALLEGQDTDGVYLVPPDFSTASVFDVADAVVTINGTIGLEASAVGIRTILAGEAYYSGHGYTLLADSVEGYRNVLQNMSSVLPLSKEEIECARDVLFCFQFFTRPHSSVIPVGFVAGGTTGAEFEGAYNDCFDVMAENVSCKNIAQDHYVKSLRRLIDREHGSICMVE